MRVDRADDFAFPQRQVATVNRPSSNSTAVGFHFGSVLGIVANQYRSLMEAILEAIQNGLDAKSTKINININQKVRNVHIQDNGVGASRAHMAKCLSLIAKSQKDRGKLGQFGIGVVASVGKCKRFSFTSRPKDKSNGALRWVFDCKALAKCATATTIPCAMVGGTDPWWRSELFIESYTANQLRSAIDFDQFCTAIYDRYGATMLKHKTTITVVLTSPKGQVHEQSLPPMDFTGTPLPVQSYDSDVCGKTTVRMFVVKPQPGTKKQRKGQGVRVMDSTGYTLPLSEKIFPGSLLKKKDADLFRSGHFEGEIIFSDKVQLDASRKFFQEDEATMEAVVHVESWLDDHGRQLIKQIEDEATAARYRRLGDQSLKVIDRFLKDKRNLKLASLIRSFKWGSQGVGHQPTDAKKGGDTTGKRANQGGGKKNPSGTGRTPRDPNKPPRPPRPKPKDQPLVVNDPDGNPRVYSKHDSTGLVLSYEQGGSDLWKLEKSYGIIRINLAHPTWVAHDRLYWSTQGVRNQLICHLQERIILHVLLSLKLADDLGADLEDILTFYAHEFEDLNQFLTTKADKIAERGRHRPKTNSKKAKDK
jgi:hypothetical protein